MFVAAPPSPTGCRSCGSASCGTSAKLVANLRSAHLARTRAQLRRMRTNTLQWGPITMDYARVAPMRTRRWVRALRTVPDFARVSHVFDRDAWGSFLATRASALLRTARVFACSSRRSVVEMALRARVFSRVTRRKSTLCTRQPHVSAPTRQNTRPRSCWRLGENTCFPRRNRVSACSSWRVSRRVRCFRRTCKTVRQSAAPMRQDCRTLRHVRKHA